MKKCKRKGVMICVKFSYSSCHVEDGSCIHAWDLGHNRMEFKVKTLFNLTFKMVNDISNYTIWKNTYLKLHHYKSIKTFIVFEVSYAHQGCIYLTKHTVKYCEIVLQFKKTFLFLLKIWLVIYSWFFSASVSHDPSEITLIWGFAA